MKKLTATMKNVLAEAINHIERAKKLDYPEWLIRDNGVFEHRPEAFAHWTDLAAAERAMAYNKERWQKAVAENYLKEYWEQERKNITLTHCGSGTLRALEDRGYIRIINDTAGSRVGIDTIEVIKFEF